MSLPGGNDRQLEALKARTLADSKWLTASELSAKAAFRSANPDEGWKVVGNIFLLKVGGEDLYPDYILNKKMRPSEIIRLILSLFKECKTLLGACYLVRLGKAAFERWEDEKFVGIKVRVGYSGRAG